MCYNKHFAATTATTTSSEVTRRTTTNEKCTNVKLLDLNNILLIWLINISWIQITWEKVNNP